MQRPLSLVITSALVASFLSLGASPAHADGTATVSMLMNSLTVAAPTTTATYDRDLFPHWIDADRDGCDTREEVLIAESTVPASTGEGCAVTGQWSSAYDGMTTTNPSEFDIDHVVALQEAWISGASGWNESQRRDFANDLDVPEALIAVSASSNRSKGASDPSEWLPELGVCEYVTAWMVVKYRWKLTIDTAEKNALTSAIAGTCATNPVTLPPVRTDLATGGAITPYDAGTTRLAGSDRYQTAIAIAASFAAGVPVLYIATGANYPDALSAAPAAAAQGGPLLLVPPTGLTAALREEIQRLSPARIVVAGGESVVSPSTFTELSRMTPEIRRDFGADRYATSRIIVERAFAAASRAFLASGANFPDALSASAAAGSQGSPVLLIPGTSSKLDAPSVGTLNRLGTQSIAIAGGPSVVSTGIETDVRNRFGSSQVVRYGGTDRYATSAAINVGTFSSASTVYLAVGTNFADALAGAAIAGQIDAPLYVVPGTCVPPAIVSHINSLGATSRVVLGGVNVLSSSVASLTTCVAPTPKSPTPKPPTTPANPGDTKNCSDFRTQREAQAWFDKHYPYYGDVARLDGNDNDRRACESLP